MAERMYLVATPEIAARRRQLAPEINAASRTSATPSSPGALPEKTKLIAVAVAHMTQCPHLAARRVLDTLTPAHSVDPTGDGCPP